MQLALIQRDYDQSWLINFLKQLKDVLLMRGNDGCHQEISREMLHEFPLLAERQDQIIDLEDITVIRENLSKMLVKNILVDYFQALKENHISFDQDLKIAFDFYGTGILVWVEPNEDDKVMEDKLLKIEMNINSKYSKQQIEMQTVVFDKSYGFEFPPQYV